MFEELDYDSIILLAHKTEKPRGCNHLRKVKGVEYFLNSTSLSMSSKYRKPLCRDYPAKLSPTPR